MTRTVLATLLVLGLGAASLAGAQGGRPFVVQLTGAAEVPGPGDPDGRGRAALTINPGQGTVCYRIEVEGIDPATLAHIHRGGADVAGPVVVTFAPPTDGSSEGCVEDLDRELLRDILSNPSGYYVNVHNATFTAGALRGQLGR